MARKGQLKNRETGEWIWRRDGFASTADWPSMWPTKVGNWPSPSQRWIPEHPGRAITVCARDIQPSLEIIEWADLAEAAEAAAVLYNQPCGADCVGVHTLLWTDDKRGVNVRSIVARTPPPPLAVELAATYPRRNGYTVTPEYWPHPTALNEPLRPRGQLMTPETQRAAVEAAANP